MLLALATACALAPAAPTRAQDAPGGLAAAVDEIFRQLEQAQGPEVWDRSLALEKLGGDAAGMIARKLTSATGAAKLAGAKAILAGDAADEFRGPAVRALKELIRGAPRGSWRSTRPTCCAPTGSAPRSAPWTGTSSG